jgi:hypothetical protein
MKYSSVKEFWCNNHDLVSSGILLLTARDNYISKTNIWIKLQLNILVTYVKYYIFAYL